MPGSFVKEVGEYRIGKGGSDQLYKYPTACIVYDFVTVFSIFKVIIHVC